ncbi:hypothetical protein AM571_PB00361 (plasmid) [Rhizobium etli 8C-3]|uniref:Uncharacterized protein n=1 Tax=Rhizobium etli 8C-3 TaxID=538025 RepID=A0A1L5PBZ2_RHIET|nr:hypothetical protein AM571_PB00361 [Rhizobium etli 8C-3]
MCGSQTKNSRSHPTLLTFSRRTTEPLSLPQQTIGPHETRTATRRPKTIALRLATYRDQSKSRAEVNSWAQQAFRSSA